MAQRFIESALGKSRGAPPEPFVFYGHLAGTAIADLVAEHSTLNCVLIDNLPQLESYLASHRVVGLIAQSRMAHSGEAGLAIALLRQFRPGAAAIYQAWDYNVERGATRAVEYGADALMMPAIEANEFFACLFAAIERASQGTPPPATVDEHRKLLEQLAPRSKFWGIQDRIVSEYY